MMDTPYEEYATLSRGDSAKQAATMAQIKPLTLAQCIDRAESLTRLAGEVNSLAEAIACQFGAGSPPSPSIGARDEVVRDTPTHIPEQINEHLRSTDRQLAQALSVLHRLAERLPL